MKKPSKLNVGSLEKAIYDLHGCSATWIKSTPVKEMFNGEIVWEGVVEVFDLGGHPTANLAYAWSHEIEESKKRKYYAVLHQGKIDSPEKAVRASIVQDFKIKRYNLYLLDY
ncbi:MAG: hypothetical protein A2Y79_11650 [Deltaproteobacteria bacterium RBG_13_43_22]|nr:MAG: hypothetical protein A2Y79_11650 [Deltaproteobacteria bacterium RBG_13_43_22]